VYKRVGSNPRLVNIRPSGAERSFQTTESLNRSAVWAFRRGRRSFRFTELFFRSAERLNNSAVWSFHSVERFNYSAERVNYSAERVNYSAERVNHSAERVNHSAERVNHSAERVNYSAERTNYSVERFNYSAERVNFPAERFNHSAERTNYSAESFNPSGDQPTRSPFSLYVYTSAPDLAAQPAGADVLDAFGVPADSPLPLLQMTRAVPATLLRCLTRQEE